jgi:hypothetical protein
VSPAYVRKSFFGNFWPLFKRDGGGVGLYKQSCKRSSNTKTKRVSFDPLVHVLPTVSLWYSSRLASYCSDDFIAQQSVSCAHYLGLKCNFCNQGCICLRVVAIWAVVDLLYVNHILLLSANATQPPIKHSPPSGVIGPSILNLCGSSTSKYMLPLNIVMPATKSEAAILFLGATDVARRRTPECIS